MPRTPPIADAPKRELDPRVASYLEAADRSLSEGKVDEALGYERLARQQADGLGPPPSTDHAAIDRAEAGRLRLDGRSGEAAERYGQALSAHRELGLGGRDTFELAYTAAVAAREAGQTEKSVQLFGEAIELAASQFGEANLPSVPARVGLAYSLIRLGRVEEADQALEHALSVCRRSGVSGRRSAALVNEAIAALRGEPTKGDGSAEVVAGQADGGVSVKAPVGARERAGRQGRLAEELEVIVGPDGAEDPEEVLRDLDADLIGLGEVKGQFRRLTNLLLVQAKRRELGHDSAERRLHLVMVGPPGTGKTTIASYLGRICHSLGMLASSDVIVASRAQLVRGHVGQTAIRTNEVIDFALDGVLFIDEAYALAPQDASNEFGPEAISELMMWPLYQ